MRNHRDIIRIIDKTVSDTLKKANVNRILVAVSGGADSVALLCACARTAHLLRLHVEAVNCNFHLRGEESDRDSEFTAELCRKFGVRIHRIDYDVAGYMKVHPGLSIEMACRELRYADFFRICNEQSLDRVAVAHNADDNMETMMLAMLRGSGTRGLRGMLTDNGRIIRPLLGITRAEIEDYLKAIEKDFITDSSNLSSDYRRNFIRRDVLPLLETRWTGVRKSLSKTLSIMKEESKIVEQHYRRQLQTLCPDSHTLFVYAKEVTTGTILRFIEDFGGNPNIADEIMASIGKEFGERSWRLSERHYAFLERDRLIISDHQATAEETELTWQKIEMSQNLMEEIKINRSHDIIYLPHDESAYELRQPRKGDRMSPLGMKGTRLVSDIISDARLDRSRKVAVRVLVRRSDGEIIWVIGLKRSRHELIKPNTDFAFKATAVNITANSGIKVI